MVYKDQDLDYSPTPQPEQDSPTNFLKSPSKESILGIIGHLESDEKILTAKLRRSPDLAEPITEAQQQLKRLKCLMFSIFGPKQVPLNIELDRQLERKTNTDLHKLNSNDDVSKLFGGQVESTRLDGSTMASTAAAVLTTPRHSINAENIFSPIVFDTEAMNCNTSQSAVQLMLGDDISNVTPLDSSLTRYQLSDLTERLGGTGLSYSTVSI